METNISYFQIQRSVDGANWSEIATIAAAGNSSSVLSYAYTDLQSAAGTNYYRVKEVDLDGRFALSPVLKSACGEKDVFNVYPNPTQGELWISVSSEIFKNLVVRIYDEKGAIVIQQKQSISPGINLFRVNLTNHPAATYILVALQDGSQPKIFKIEKR